MIFVEIITILLACLPLILLVYAIRDGWDAIGSIFSLQKYFLSSRRKDEMRHYLRSFTYYRNLSREKKDVFFDRVLTFMYSNTFEGMEGLKVTDQMKVLISASAVQLTFGLRNFRLTHVETIRIYPTVFKGPDRRAYKGMTTNKGSMAFSWDNFNEGYANDSDRYNLGLHEMSHGLQLTLFLGSELDKRFAGYYDDWQAIASREFSKMKHSGRSFLREYAATSKSEFFAVCIEHFFEAPEEFQQALPDVFHHLAVLLNQNPLNASNDYRLDKDFISGVNSSKTNIPVPEKVDLSFRYVSWHWSLTLLLVGVFGGSGSIVYLYDYTADPVCLLAFIYLLCGGIGLLQRNYFMRKEILEKRLFSLYVLAGFAPTLMAAVLWLNYLIPMSASWQEEYKITDYTIEHRTSKKSRRSAISGYTLDLENGAYRFTPSVRSVGTNYHYSGRIIFQFRTGLFGMKIREGYSFPPGEKLPQP